MFLVKIPEIHITYHHRKYIPISKKNFKLPSTLRPPLQKPPSKALKTIAPGGLNREFTVQSFMI